MPSTKSHREALKIAGLTAATGALGVATLWASPAHAVTGGTPALHNEKFAKLLEAEATKTLKGNKIPELPEEAITADSDEDAIYALQARLKWAALSDEKPSGTWTDETTAGVKMLQWKTSAKQTGNADAKTVAALSTVATTNAIDKKCIREGDALCVDKTQKVVRFVSDGKVIKTFHVNIGPEKGDKNFGKYSATREGSFKVGDKQKNAISSLYGYKMPYWMQFDKGIGFHYSEYFDKSSYTEASMGCVILGSKSEARWLYNHTDMETARVVVYSS